MEFKRSVVFFGLTSGLLFLAVPHSTAQAATPISTVSAPKTAACQAFSDFAIRQKIDPSFKKADGSKLKPFMTDAMVVLKDGREVFNWYDGAMNPERKHVLWSASKMITATLVGRTIQEGHAYDGKPVTLDTPLADFFPQPSLLKKNPEQKAFYDRIRLENLVEMSANFVWREAYESDTTKSTFLPMLYLGGRSNMLEFALSQPMGSEGPGGRWVYSGGNANILQAVLQKIHGPNYLEMPGKILFNPLGITDWAIERDGSGRFIGSSYVYLRVGDMAKVGELYRNNGLWNGKRLLSEEWVKAAQELTPAVENPATPVDYIAEEGAQSKRVFWLNRDVNQNGKVVYGAEFPKAPKDLYFAAGHYGQLIMVIPSEKLVIARTGWDESYWGHIEALVVKAKECFQ